MMSAIYASIMLLWFWVRSPAAKIPILHCCTHVLLA
jgi:hypothetical protein